MLNIFNNGSQLWIAFILLIIWVAIWGYRTYKSHKSGYEKDMRKNGLGFVKVEGGWKALLSNPNFIFLVLGTIGLVAFIIWVNAEYK